MTIKPIIIEWSHQPITVDLATSLPINVSVQAVGAAGVKGDAGVSDHGALTGLGDDDHLQYHTDTRGDALYYRKGAVDTALGLKADKSDTFTKAETDSRIQAVVGAAPAALDTLAEIATQLQNDESAATALAGQVTALSSGKENTGVAAGLVSAHTAAADPHLQYHTDARGDARYMVNVTSIAALKALNTAQITTAYLNLAGKQGIFRWDGTITIATHQIDAADVDGIGEGVLIAPNAAANGAWVREAEYWVSPMWYGLTLGTGKTSPVWDKNRRAIQRAIDAVYFGLVKTPVVLPAGDIEYSGTIHQGYGTTYAVVHVRGQGKRYFGGVSGSGTALWHKGATDYQAWNMQGGRNPVLSDLSLTGSTLAAVQAVSFATTDVRLTAANWNVATDRVSDGGDGRYNPYAGLTVDAFAGVRPGSSYPDVTYPSNLGVVAQYGKLMTSQMTLRNVDISGFVVGIANQPCNADGNGDYLFLDRCNVTHCKYLISVGNGQSRLVNAKGCLLNGAYTCLVNNKHGKQLGQYGGTFDSCEFGIAVWIGDFILDYITNIRFIGCKSESLWSLFMTSGSGGSLTMSECDINLSWQLDANLGIPAYTITGTNANVEFQHCTLRHATLITAEGTGIKFSGYGRLTNSSLLTPAGAYAVPFNQAFPGGFVPGQRATLNQEIDFRNMQLTTDRATGSATGWRCTSERLTEAGSTPGRNKFLPIYHRTSAFDETLGISQGRKPVSRPVWAVARAKSTTTWTLAARILTLTITAGLTDITANTDGYMPGDMIRCRETGTVFVAKSRSSNVITYLQMNNYTNQAGNALYVAIPASGTWDVFNCRVYSFSGGSANFSTTVGSPTMTFVDGTFPSELAAGDILLTGMENGCFLNGVTESIVLSVTPSTTITMTGNARKTGTVQLAFAISVAPPNAP